MIENLIPESILIFEGWYNIANNIKTAVYKTNSASAECGLCNSGCSGCGGHSCGSCSPIGCSGCNTCGGCE